VERSKLEICPPGWCTAPVLRANPPQRGGTLRRVLLARSAGSGSVGLYLMDRGRANFLGTPSLGEVVLKNPPSTHSGEQPSRICAEPTSG
jgi:hypothetical protein